MAELKAKLAELTAKLAKLEDDLAKAKKNSSNSSKPPSGDIVNPATDKGKDKKKGGKKRNRGGQPGHPRHQRRPFQPEEIDVTWVHYDTGCPCCGGKLVTVDEPPGTFQQVGWKTSPFVSRSTNASFSSARGAIGCTAHGTPDGGNFTTDSWRG
jgi:transposase